MAGQTADQIAASWAQNLGGATSKIQAGVQAVTTSPGQLAARQKAAWIQNLTAAQDKWASRTAGVSLSSWQNDMITKGIPRIAQGASAAQAKFATFMGQLLPYIQRGQQQLPARGNLDANINRMTAWVRYMAQFSSTRTTTGG